MEQSIVSSFNEWDPLEEVIVGTVRGAVRPDYEPAFAPYLTSADQKASWESGPYSSALRRRAEWQLDNFASLLSRLGVTVRRPDPIDHSVGFTTPDFASEYGHAQACPRDVLLVVGNHLIEATMAQRSRYFEYRAYRSLIKEYFRGGARWTAAPKPFMGDDLYVRDHDTISEPFDFTRNPNLTEFEPCFDAASFARLGRDILWQPDTVSNQFGADWLQRQLGPDYRIHRVEFEDRHPCHIDATLVPLRPGLLMTNPGRPAKGDCLRMFTDSGWESFAAVPSVNSRDRAGEWEVSDWISLNILSLDESTVIVEKSEEPLMAQLKSHGFEVIPCEFDAVYPFGGSFHCATVDVRRRGELKSYL